MGVGGDGLCELSHNQPGWGTRPLPLLQAIKMVEKCCIKCGEAKPVSEFYKNKNAPGGLRTHCKGCMKIYSREWRIKNPEQWIKAGTEWYVNNKERALALSAKRYKDHGDQIRAQHAKYRAAHSGKNTKWCRENPDKILARTNRRRARKVNAAGTARAEQIAARREFYGEACYICGGLVEAMDHVKPLAAGDSNWPANLRPICNRCNSAKGATWPYVFSLTKTVESRGFNQIS